mmetsp:Transcript_22609/g.35367  ORF Transcript_22609/g.35367 Transcript_22609/m.35367 type:complete len:112 (-) Transcript_22609:19-354(-)
MGVMASMISMRIRTLATKAYVKRALLSTFILMLCTPCSNDQHTAVQISRDASEIHCTVADLWDSLPGNWQAQGALIIDVPDSKNSLGAQPTPPRLNSQTNAQAATKRWIFS